MKSDQKNPITLEDLLRLKRAERPPAEFWPEFERELRAKQLAALVTRRPWWRTLPQRAFAGLARYHLPLGATAVLALTFISVREYQTTAPERGLAPNSGAPSVAATSASAETEITAANTGAIVLSLPAREEFAAVSTPVDETASTQTVGERATEPQALTGDVSAMNTLVGVAAPGERDELASARSIPENFTAVQTEGQFNRSLLGNQRGFETRVMPARAVDPLAQMTPPSQARRSRYLGKALPASAATTPPAGRSSERLANRLSDDRLYESVSRYAFGGDRVSLMVKF